nr:MAG TPA: hypothetical protein [Caudoviricetes sp.]
MTVVRLQNQYTTGKPKKSIKFVKKVQQKSEKVKKSSLF